MSSRTARSPRPAVPALSPGCAPVGMLAGIRHALAATVRAWRHRARARRELRELDDSILRDIGLSRAQAQFDADRPLRRG